MAANDYTDDEKRLIDKAVADIEATAEGVMKGVGSFPCWVPSTMEAPLSPRVLRAVLRRVLDDGWSADIREYGMRTERVFIHGR